MAITDRKLDQTEVSRYWNVLHRGVVFQHKGLADESPLKKVSAAVKYQSMPFEVHKKYFQSRNEIPSHETHRFAQKPQPRTEPTNRLARNLSITSRVLPREKHRDVPVRTLGLKEIVPTTG